MLAYRQAGAIVTRDITTIECPRALHSRLTDLKLNPHEPLASVILRYLPEEDRPTIPPEMYPLNVRIRKKEEVIE